MRRILICLLAILPLAGCELLPYDRELESTLLIQVLGVDWTQDGVTLTAVAAPDGDTDGKETILSVTGNDLEQSKSALKGMGEEYIALTHVTQLVLPENDFLPDVLMAALLDSELGQSATVWVVRDGTAKDLLEGGGGGARRLSAIEVNTDSQRVSVLQGAMHFAEDGQVELPVLALQEGNLVPAGTKLVREADYGT